MPRSSKAPASSARAAKSSGARTAARTSAASKSKSSSKKGGASKIPGKRNATSAGKIAPDTAGFTPDALFARVVNAVRGASAAEHARIVGLVAERCRSAGRTDLADALVGALPKKLRAEAAHDPAAVVSAALAAIQRSDSYRLQQELAKLMSGGHHAEARAVLTRLNEQGRAMLANLALTNGEIAVLRDAPDLALSILDGLSDWFRHAALEHASVIDALATWPRAHLLELARRADDGTITRLGAVLVALGRADDARAILFPDGGPPVSPKTQMNRLRIVGDLAKLDAFIAEPNLEDYDWTRMRIERGVDTVAGTLSKLEASPTVSVMHDVDVRHFLAGVALERREIDAFDAILASIDRTMQRPERIQYDIGMEATTRGKIHDLHVQRALAVGDTARAKEILEQQFAGLVALMNAAAANVVDPGMRIHSKGDVAEAFVMRAGKAGYPALALKGGIAMSPAERERRAALVAGYLLPGDPAGAVKAFETMTGKNAQQQWLGPFFVDIWSALL